MTIDPGTSLTSAVSAVGAVSAVFRGADADELRSNAQRMTQAAQVVDEVKAACQAIVAASFFLGPFGASFIAYLEHTVIPWLTKVSQALQLLSKVLSFHAGAQDDAQSSASLPSYSSPTGATTPPVPSGADSAGTAWTNSLGTASTNNAGTPWTAGATGGATSTLGAPIAPIALPSQIAPGSALGTLEIPVAVSPDGQITPLLTAGDLGGSYDTPGPVDTTGVSTSVPSTSSWTATPVPNDITLSSTPPSLAALHHTTPAELNVGPGSGGIGDGSGGINSGGGSSPAGSASMPSIPRSTGELASYSPSAPAIDHHLVDNLTGGLVDTAGHPAELTAAPGGTGASHDGLFAGLGQATGIGAGGAALARAVIVEARRATVAGPLPGLPADAQSDAAPQWQIFDSTLG